MTTHQNERKEKTSGLAATVEAMQRRALVKGRDKKTDDSVQLPLWPAEMRAIPNDYARSALFTVRNKKTPRAAMMSHEIFHVNQEVQISFTGIELRADDDELVWQQVLLAIHQLHAQSPPRLGHDSQPPPGPLARY